MASSMFLGVLLVLEVTAFFWKGDEIRKDHTTNYDMVEWGEGIRHDVLAMVIVQPSAYRILNEIN